MSDPQFVPPPHPKCGISGQAYVYRDAEGRPVLVANRYDSPGKSKFFLPYDVSGDIWKAPDIRPLYNLNRLTAAAENIPVIAVEGEKCADALTGLGFLATTVFGGCNAVKKADISPLKNRTIIIWPDHDEPGRKYAASLAAALRTLGNTRVFTVSPDMEFHENLDKSLKINTRPQGWDAADAIAEGWTRAMVDALIQQAISSNQAQQETPTTHAEEIELWHSPSRETFATVSQGPRRKTWALDSHDFRQFLSYRHYQAEGKILSQAALEDQRRTMAGEALFEGPEYPVFTRLGMIEDHLYLDLGGAEWDAVRITPEGWQIIPTSPARFRRSPALQALPSPGGPGNVELLRPFLNVGSDTDFRMLLAWLLGCFQPRGPYPILILTGEQGSAKSTTAKVLRRLIDPAEPITRSAPQSEQDLVIAARHNHVLAFDNLSHIKPSIADALCRIATGGGFGTRKLHTNAEEMLFNATRPCLLNGIPDLASRPDLADRSIIVSLPVIPDTKRQYEGEFWKSFDQAAPRILAGLLDAVSTALRRLPEVSLSERPRMADFARWVSAAEPALGWPEGAFMSAYDANRQSVDTAAIEGNPVAEAILSMIADHGTWAGTATDLSKALRRLYPHLTDDPLIFPRQPNRLSSELRRVQPLLRRAGITLSKTRSGETGRRQIHIRKEA